MTRSILLAAVLGCASVPRHTARCIPANDCDFPDEIDPSFVPHSTVEAP